MSRAHFKLEQLDRRFRLVSPGICVLELGAAPGGWTAYIESRLGPRGRLIVCDSRPVHAGSDTVVVIGKFGDAAVEEAIAAALDDGAVDLVLSDMSPNITGIRVRDQAESLHLAELALEAAERWLKPGGCFVVKMFMGEGTDALVREIGNKFARIRRAKPGASRQESREIYVVGQQFLA
ncbi:MAG: 23S rRNA methyltransferase [Pseudomonadales bacterium]|nr:RlmE family RNA methyltransferase [Pseudomonadales bacterium]NIX09377.1 23S rRNA methyltransferase [Pseudomonadales bacterium]